MLCLFFSSSARYRPEHSRPIPEGKAKVAVTTTTGGGKDIEATARNSRSSSTRERDSQANFRVLPSETPSSLSSGLELIRGFDRAAIREVFLFGGGCWGDSS